MLALSLKVSEEVTTDIVDNSTIVLRPSPRTSSNIRIMLYFQKLLAYCVAADSIWLYIHAFFPGWLRKTHLFCKSACRSFKVIRGHWFRYESKARTRDFLSTE